MSGYIGPVPTPQATQSRDYFTATAGQTSFPTAGYTPGYLDVYLNGVHLQDSDFTATNGSDVVLATGAAAGDVFTVVSWSTFEATNVDYSNVQNTPTLANVATSGAYSDLSGTPTAVSNFTNDANYATQAYVDTAESDAVSTANAYTDTEIANLDALPSQTGNSGKYLTTDGTTASWDTVTSPTISAVSDQGNTSTGYIDLPSGTTSQRPGTPANGMIRYNTDFDQYEVYVESTWRTVNTSATQYSIEVFLIAGGGGGGSHTGGGGGGGGLILRGSSTGGKTANGSGFTVNKGGTYSIVVGAAGAGASGSNVNGTSGNNSTGFSQTAIGGGGGGSVNSGDNNGHPGGCGGGGSRTGGSAGTSGQGFAGGPGPMGVVGGGGGGTAAAGNGGSSPNPGGSGHNIWLYAIGGGGGGAGEPGYSDAGSGGYGGGGNGSQTNGNTAGATSTGGGGGAGGYTGGTAYPGKSGGSGRVVIRYPGTEQQGSGGTVTINGGYVYHDFTSSGTFTV